ALTDDECRRLLTAAVAGQSPQNMKGDDRAMLYRAALETGLRAGELRTLTVGACHLQDNPPVLIVKAAYSKHRREDVQPIPLGLAEALSDHTAGREADELVFPGMPNRTAHMLRRDLKAARDQWIDDADTERERERREKDKNFLQYRNSANMVADFHALRHTYITNLARIGVHPKTAMDLARHGNINLTMARYSHTLVSDRAGVLGALPSLGSSPEAEKQKATGTHDAVAQIVDFPSDTTSRTTSRENDNRKLLSIKPLGENGTGLENQRARKGTVGSNPTPTVACGRFSTENRPHAEQEKAEKQVTGDTTTTKPGFRNHPPDEQFSRGLLLTCSTVLPRIRKYMTRR
ncbi:MAG: site-specific integrase, partial [Phycisphaerae bacterium]|nr:site-specific integrase [Phycisphaerae bacterium]